jgi:DNA repair protein RecN (Recombination protein N)
MLLGINLKNFAIIDDLSIGFGKNLNIITGETGTGKSIIVDAINIILGDKASVDLIKSDKEEAQIEALFDVRENRVLKERLQSLGFETEGEEVVIKRIISRTGRGRVFINGSLATFSMLDQVTEGLVDIFSQHEHQSLLREERHLQVLDEFGGLKELTQKLGEIYQRYIRTKKELEECERNQREQVEREDFLRFQLGEIDAAKLKPDEDELLEEERRKLANAERLYSMTQEAYETLYEGEESVLDALKRVSSRVEEAIKIDSALLETAKSIEKGILEIKEAAFTLRDYASSILFDPDRLNYIEGRLREIKRLKRKYGGTISEILQRREKIEEELGKISNYEERLKVLRKDIDDLESEIDIYAKELSKKRHEAAERLESAVTKELGEVGIKGGRFVVEFEKKEVSSNGCDKVTFLFSANPDEKPKPLTKIASGGELSRIMLVLKEVLARVEGSSVLIFDEADSGIGGAVAEVVGKKIKNLSKTHQVICITHLPQVAKFADIHFRVTKTFRDGKTEVRVKALDDEERIKEVARMLSGLKITEKTIEAAREMLKK